ncbi:hypothetical protein EVB98_033 [Rhizobium phage RHph_N3_2]|nr:hypothetical protein EVB98_033 [Rhizobium phage RHph_N3_2]QIG75031.1 hypothetical protein EVC14_033 [Rhizobium phage RHph_I3_18]
MRDHARLCEGREYTCTCGYDRERDDLQVNLLEALKYARRYMNHVDHDTAWIDGIISKAEASA